MRGYHLLFPLLVLVALSALVASGERIPAKAAPGAVTVRELAYGLPHIFADTDLELARENGREVAKDRLGQLILLSRVGRGTLFQAFGPLDASTFNDDAEVRREGYTSSELNNMFAKLPASEQALVLEYSKGVNDTIEAIYAGSLPEPLEVSLLRSLGLGNDLFGNATDVSDGVDIFYKAPGGADPERPNAGFQFTPELVMSIAVLQVRNFGSESFGEASRLTELDSLVSKFGATIGTKIWDDLNFLNDPLAPVSVPDPNTPGFGGPLVQRKERDLDLAAYAELFPDYDYDAAIEPARQRRQQREEFARRLGAWPMLGSYSWMIDGDLSATGNPWLGGFPQTGELTPSIMHFIEMRSAEGADHRIQAMGMAFAGAPIVLIGQTDNVAWTSTTAQLKNNDFYLDKLILESTDALRYNDEGTPAPMSVRTDQIRHTDGTATPLVIWRTHERADNGGSRTVEAFQGDASSAVEVVTATSLTDAGAFSEDFVGGYVAIIAGIGAGQMRAILSNTNDTLALADAWTTTPDDTSVYVAVKATSEIVVISRERVFWLEESTSAQGFSIFQRAEDVLDIRRGSRMIPSTHNFIAADNQAFNGIGTNLGPANGNIGYYSAGFSRVRQGVAPTDTRLPMDGSAANELVVVGGSVDGATTDGLASSAAFVGQDFSPPPPNFRLDDPTQSGSEYIVTITGGAGYRQTRRISSNTDNDLTLEENWGVMPAPGDLFEIYEIVAMPEALNPPQGYSTNWNNKAATADDGRNFGRQQRSIFIAERLAADSTWTRDEQRQLNKDLAGLSGEGKIGRYLIPRLRQAVDGVGNGGNPDVDTVLAALEAHNGAPFFGRGFIDPLLATEIEGEIIFLGGNPFGPEVTDLIRELSDAIFGDEFAGTGIAPPGGTQGLALVQHAIDSAAGGPAGAYAQEYSGDYFNGTDWRLVVRDALSNAVTALGGIPADIPRPDSSFDHPLSALYPKLMFASIPIGNRGAYEQIVEVGPTVLGEFIFPLGQSGFSDTDGVPDRHADSLHDVWRDWRFVPMLHVAEDLATDPDGDIDNDGVLDGFERWYFGSSAPLPTDDSDGDELHLLGEALLGLDPTDPDTDDNGTPDGAEDPDQDGCTNATELGEIAVIGGLRDPKSFWDFFDTPNAENVRDRAITIADIGRLVARFGTFGDPAIDPLSPPPASGYHTAFDRTPLGPNLWNLGAPNGNVTIQDVGLEVAQFGHSCG